jgi:hypothetical protein
MSLRFTIFTTAGYATTLVGDPARNLHLHLVSAMSLLFERLTHYHVVARHVRRRHTPRDGDLP